MQATDGNFYGTTRVGGTFGVGTVFKITPSGALTTLHSFDITDGEFPYAGLVQAADGSFYGTTSEGGAYGAGTVFKITPSGMLTTLYNFCSAGFLCPDGSTPYAGLVQGTDGNFYGTTLFGGTNNYGVIFRITPSGSFTTLYRFCAAGFPCADGSHPYAGLVQATDGNFYGMTFFGGANGACSAGCGTIFRITAGGTLTTVHSFNIADGSPPDAR